MLLPTLSLPTKEIVREHTPPKPKRSKENDSSENSTQEMEKETVDEGHMDEPNDVSIFSDVLIWLEGSTGSLPVTTEILRCVSLPKLC
jgi:hypothetical protein